MCDARVLDRVLTPGTRHKYIPVGSDVSSLKHTVPFMRVLKGDTASPWRHSKTFLKKVA